MLQQVYNDSISQISVMFAEKRGIFERRTDTYIACSNDFGLKFRKEKNLELKVKQVHTGNLPASSGIEIYMKDKIKKLDDGLDDAKFKSKVKKHLRQMNYSQHDSENVDILLDNSHGKLDRNAINVEKSRINTQIVRYRAMQEYCILSTSFKHPRVTVATAVTSPVTPGTGHDVCHWVSVAYEGDLEYFFREGLPTDTSQLTPTAVSADSHSGLNSLLWRCVYTALLAGRENGGQLAIPVVVAGYPTWVQYIALMQGRSQAQNEAALEQERHIFTLLSGFVEFLGTIIPTFPDSVDVTTVLPRTPSPTSAINSHPTTP